MKKSTIIGFCIYALLLIIVIWAVETCANSSTSDAHNRNPTVYHLTCYQFGQLVLDEIVTGMPDMGIAYTYPEGNYVEVPSINVQKSGTPCFWVEVTKK